MRVLHTTAEAERSGNHLDGAGRDMAETPRMTPAQRRKARDLWMARLEAAGYCQRDIAAIFNLTDRQVRRRLQWARGVRHAAAC